jgi:hypothetical protein
MAEWSNAPDSKSGIQVSLYRGFESLSLRQPMIPQRLAALSLAVLVACGCASRSTDIRPVAVSAGDFALWRCDALHDEIDRVQQRAADVAYAVDARAGNNVIALGIGVMVFWPALLAMRPDGPEALELARLKGRFDALRAAAAAQQCPPPADTLPPAIAAQLPVAVGERLVYEERSGTRGPARELRLRLDALRRGLLEFGLEQPNAARRRWQQDLAGNPVGAHGSGLLSWTRLLRRDLALGDVLAGDIHDAEGTSGRLRGQVIAIGVQNTLGRPFDAAVVELFGEVPDGDSTTRLDGVMVVDRKSGVLLRLELRSANPDFAVRRTLLRIEPVS